MLLELLALVVLESVLLVSLLELELRLSSALSLGASGSCAGSRQDPHTAAASDAHNCQRRRSTHDGRQYRHVRYRFESDRVEDCKMTRRGFRKLKPATRL